MELVKFQRYITRKLLISLMIIFMILMSSIKIIDSYVDSYTTDAIQNAAISYATARGINALVSMLQTSTVEAEVFIVSGSITIGELLDPINDLIERFSSIMTLVLGSLAAQKILLLISSNYIFNLLILVLGSATLITILLNKQKYFDITFKSFLIAIFIRFSLVLAVMLNGAADHLFLIEQTKEYNSDIYSFKLAMENISDSKAKPANKNDLLTQLTSLQTTREHLKTQLIEKETEYQQLRGARKECSWSDILENSKCIMLRNSEHHLKRDTDKLNEEIDHHNRVIGNMNETISNLEPSTSSSSKRLIEVWKDKLPDISIDSIGRKVENSITSFMNLMAIYILKTTVLPLLFFYLVIFIYKKLWRMETFSIN